jgi:hypothetical protein
MGIVGTAEEIRKKAAAPYAELASMSAQAKADLETLETKNRLTAQNDHELAILNDDPATVKKRADLSLQASADIDKLRRFVLKRSRSSIFRCHGTAIRKP